MTQQIIALIDCDSFFVSCEQALDESLRDKPVCVISGERGCVLARSQEAKAMGVKMGMPYFMAIKEFPEAIYIDVKHQVYKDFSRKIMAILRDFGPTVEVYSIDEAFVELSGLKKLYKTDYFGIAKLIRDRIKSDLSINVSVGISRSKVLAKLACEMAKPGASNSLPPLRGRGFFDARDERQKNWEGGISLKEGNGIYLIGKNKISKILKATKVQQIWGIGKNTTLLFNRWGVLNCEELVQKSDEWLKTRIGKRGVELKHELLGEYIDKVKPVRKLPKSIQNTRSFPEFIKDLDYIKNALNVYIHTSWTKLRYLGGKCKTVSVMLRTKDFQVFWEKKNLEDLSNFELEISRTALKLLEKIYDPNLVYRSCGVTLEGLDFSEESQLSIFDCGKKDFDKLGKALDKLEKKFGKDVVKTGFLDTNKQRGKDA